jgi:glycerol-3-phosphate dehydrogenase (NAD(P)+)
MPDSHTVAVLGGGSFGTVIANIIAGNGNKVRLWMRNPRRCETIQAERENTDYLPGFALHDNLQATTSLTEAVTGTDIVFVAVPSKSFRTVVRRMVEYLQPGTLVVSLTKGIESGGFKLMSQVLAEELPDNPLGVLSGPNLAGEIAAGHITGSVIASATPAINW